MKPYIGGRRTRIRKLRPDRIKRKYKNKFGKYPLTGGNVKESLARESYINISTCTE
jgi:hypothetical protein